MQFGGPEFVLGIIGIGTACHLVGNWIRARHGYPVESETGQFHTREGTLPSARKVELLEAENARLGGMMTRMEDRLATMERIVTDPGKRVSEEIERLR